MAAKKQQVRKKHIPQRTCIICRTVRDKRDLVRIVRTPTQIVELDETGKAPGRGAYICRDGACRTDKSVSKEAVVHALKMTIQDEHWASLQDKLDNLP